MRNLSLNLNVLLMALCGLGLSACDKEEGDSSSDDSCPTETTAALTDDGTTTPATDGCPAATINSDSTQPAGSDDGAAGGDDGVVLDDGDGTGSGEGSGSGSGEGSGSGSGEGSGSDSGSDDGADDQTYDLHLTLTPPMLEKATYGGHEVLARTATFTHDGTSVQCSHDDGATFAACDSASSIVFTVADINLGNVLKVRVAKGASHEDFTYNPSTAHPGVKFWGCDRNVTADMNADDFSDLLEDGANAMAPFVVCLKAGVKVNDAGGSFVDTDSAQNVLLLGAGDEMTASTIQGLAINDTMASGGSNANLFKVSGIRLVNGASSSYDAVQVLSKQQVRFENVMISSVSSARNAIGFRNYQSDIEVKKSYVVGDGNNTNVLKVIGAGASNSVVTFEDSELHSTSPNSDMMTDPASGTPGITFNFNHCKLIHEARPSGYGIVYMMSASNMVMNFTDTLLDGGLIIFGEGQATFNISESTLIGDRPIWLHATGNHVNLGGTHFEKYLTGSTHPAIDLGADGNEVNDTDAAGHKNSFCNQASSPTFIMEIGFGYTYTGTFDPIQTENGDNMTIGLCPAG